MSVTIACKTQSLRKYAGVAGHSTDKALAQLLQIDQGNLSRVLNGKQRPGGVFIASCLRAFPALDFADLFEVVDAPAEAA
ncbi:MAG: hypothetical protein U0R76_10925 [Candidatus Nanopelagicales bacterium]